ncbi:MAG: TetR/AcrR family transcriptional regulator [Propionicimonas sp.]|uniref:TetR/AcrR family transcriptional regulator n=1 Tax=Propionicimonas sp. TaxID=1955623 RepID=UPI003D0FE97D
MRRNRRSAAEVEAAIHAAVLAELAAGGYAAVTFEGIARRAHTSKPVLYRRYPDRASMIFAAVRERGPVRRMEASTGSLRDDLLALLQTSFRRAADFGSEAYRALIGEARDETLAEVAGLNADLAVHLDAVIVAPARERGELGPLPLDLDVILTPMRLGRDRLVFGPFTDEDVVAIVDKVALPLYRAASGLPPAAVPPED